MRLLFLVLCWAVPSFAVNWVSLLPQPGVARDVAMGGATGALFGSPSAVSQNPAGIVCFPQKKRVGVSAVLNGNGAVQLPRYLDQSRGSRSTLEQTSDISSLLVRAVAARYRWMSATAIFAEPVMLRGDSTRFDSSDPSHALTDYETSLLAALLLHPRVQVAGRVDFYTKNYRGDGEGFSYGVILKPRGVLVGLHYQRYPATGERWLSPLDRRVDQGTTASVALQQPEYTLAFQLNNLSRSDELGFLEPRVGAEWRPVRALALRTGGSVYTRSRRALVSAGLGLADANWFRLRERRLRVPEDVLSLAVALVYEHGRPVEGYSAITLAWRL